MAYFKKRRAKTLSKHEERELKASREASQLRAAGVIGTRFPSVKRVSLTITLLDARKNPLEEKSVSLGPPDPAVFKQACSGMCGQGVFDFSARIADAVAAADAAADFSVPCPEKQGSGAPCGCEARVALRLEYLPS